MFFLFLFPLDFPGLAILRVRVRVRERVRESSRLRSGGSLQAHFTPDPPSPCRVKHGSRRVRVRVRSRLRLDRPPAQGLGQGFLSRGQAPTPAAGLSLIEDALEEKGISRNHPPTLPGTARSYRLSRGRTSRGVDSKRDQIQLEKDYSIYRNKRKENC